MLNSTPDLPIRLSNPVTSKCLSILYLGIDSGTSRHRALSLRRLGHKVRHLNPHSFLPPGRITDFWNHHTGALGLGKFVRARVLNSIRNMEFDLAWVDAGNLICPELVQDLKRQARFVINYNVDDPYGTRDSNKWRIYLRSVPYYDRLVVLRECNVVEAYQAGATAVMRVYMSSDEVAHAPRKVTVADRAKWSSELAFVGTWMPERGPFLARLAGLGLPVSIWGDRWSKAKEWPILRRLWKGPALRNDDDYAMAIQCAKVCIGLISKGNRDLCTQRSFEIPQLGGVLCAERTPEHLALYRQDTEAVFWGDPNECAEKCRRLLSDENWRNQVARNGQIRATRNATANQVVMNEIICRVFDSQQAEALVSR
jgi:spore maturation protein CgeB